MRIEPTQPTTPIHFNGYNSKLKVLYKAHKMPQVKIGFYGDRLNIENCSIEHLFPISKGGKTKFSNMVLATKDKNNVRSDKPLYEFIDFKAMAKYLEQFRNINVDGFNGNFYIAQILQTVGECLQKGL